MDVPFVKYMTRTILTYIVVCKFSCFGGNGGNKLYKSTSFSANFRTLLCKRQIAFNFTDRWELCVAVNKLADKDTPRKTFTYSDRG